MTTLESRSVIFADQTASEKASSLPELFQALLQFVQEAAASGKPLHEIEQVIVGFVLRIGHVAVDIVLAAQGDGDLGETVTTEEGQTLHRSPTPQPRRIRTIFGEHYFEAYVYSAGPKTKIAFRPIDARLSLPEGEYSYLLQEFTQFFCVDHAFGKASEALERVLGQRIPVDSLERITRQMAEPAEEFLDNLPAPPAEEEGELLVMTADNKGVRMLRRDLPPVPAGSPTPRRGTRQKATVAAVYSVDRYVRTAEEVVAALFRDEQPRSEQERPRPCHKHVVARLARTYRPEGSEPIEASAMEEGLTWAAFEVRRRLRPEQVLVRICDGERALWQTGRECLERECGGPVPAVEIADIVHVSSYVWQAAKVLCPTETAQEQFARDRLLRILQGEVKSVVRGLRQMATRRGLRGASRREVDRVCQYLENNADRMRYDEYLREGYPIASGVIEGACRHLVKDRLERSGMRWTAQGAQAMLSVRALYASDLWDEFHQWRREVEQTRLHPHRYLLAAYTPPPPSQVPI